MKQRSGLDAQQAVALYRKAARANRKTRARSGNVIHLTDEHADDVMVTADLHGHRHNFSELLRIADLDKQTRRHLVLQEVCHGGPVSGDGGACLSYVLLEEVAQLKCDYADRVHFIMSNHELAEMTDYPILKGQRMLNLSFRSGLQEQYGDDTDKVRGAYLDFLQSCPIAVRIGEDVLVTHSLPEALDMEPFDETIFDRPLEPDDYAEHGSLFNMVWGRDYRQKNAQAFAELVDAKVLIHGHEPCEQGYVVPNKLQVILDCCGDPAAYVILPADRPLTQEDVVERIELLE